MANTSSFMSDRMIKEETEEMMSIADQSDTTKLIDVDLSLFDVSAEVKNPPKTSGYTLTVTSDT